MAPLFIVMMSQECIRYDSDKCSIIVLIINCKARIKGQGYNTIGFFFTS